MAAAPGPTTSGYTTSFFLSGLADAEINTDRSLRLQYLAGLAVDFYRNTEIYEAMARYRLYPSDLFVAPEWIEQQLRSGYR